MRSFLFACTELETQQATRMWNRDRELNHGFRTCRKGSLLDSDTRAHVDLVVGEQGDELWALLVALLLCCVWSRGRRETQEKMLTPELVVVPLAGAKQQRLTELQAWT